MTRDEMIEILEGIARDPNAYPNARITAIRTLRQMADDEDAGEQTEDDLYRDELAARRRGKARRCTA